jgi:hypothetical protein
MMDERTRTRDRSSWLRLTVLNAHDLEGYYDLCADDFAYIGTTERRGKSEARS